jgi:hypothetical protein
MLFCDMTAFRQSRGTAPAPQALEGDALNRGRVFSDSALLLTAARFCCQ